MVVVGIGSHKDTLAGCHIDRTGWAVDYRTFSDTTVGHREPARRVAELGAARVVIDGSGNYGRRLTLLLVAADDAGPHHSWSIPHSHPFAKIYFGQVRYSPASPGPTRVHDPHDLSLHSSYSETLRKFSLSEGIEDEYRRYGEDERSEECPVVGTILASELRQSNGQRSAIRPQQKNLSESEFIPNKDDLDECNSEHTSPGERQYDAAER